MLNSTEYIAIGQVARKCGLNPSALRYYESVGILPAPQRASGQRLYDASVFKRIRLIQAAKQAGFSIAEIKTLLDGAETELPYSRRMQELARRKLAHVNQLIVDAQSMKRILEAGLACECSGPEDCLLLMNE